MNASHEVYVFECNVTQHGIHMDLVIKDILDKLAGSGIITREISKFETSYFVKMVRIMQTSSSELEPCSWEASSSI